MILKEGNSSRISITSVLQPLYNRDSMATFSRCFAIALALALPFRVTGFASSSTGSGGDVSTLLHVAAEALGRQDFAAAAKALKSAVESQPDLVPAWFNLAFAYSGLHQNEDAVKAYRKTLELKPDLFEARLNLGILFLEMNQPQAAQEQLSKSLALKPEHARAHLYYGRALTMAGQAGEAESQFREVLRLDPNLAIAYFDLGQVYLSQKRFPEARVAFENSVRLDPKLAQAQLGLALACEGLKQSAEAVTHFERYLAATPGDLETRFHLAKIYLQLGKNEQALAALQSVYAAKTETPGLAAALGDVHACLRIIPIRRSITARRSRRRRVSLSFIAPWVRPCWRSKSWAKPRMSFAWP